MVWPKARSQRSVQSNQTYLFFILTSFRVDFEIDPYRVKVRANSIYLVAFKSIFKALPWDIQISKQKFLDLFAAVDNVFLLSATNALTQQGFNVLVSTAIDTEGSNEVSVHIIVCDSQMRPGWEFTAWKTATLCMRCTPRTAASPRPLDSLTWNQASVTLKCSLRPAPASQLCQNAWPLTAEPFILKPFFLHSAQVDKSNTLYTVGCIGGKLLVQLICH